MFCKNRIFRGGRALPPLKVHPHASPRVRQCPLSLQDWERLGLVVLLTKPQLAFLKCHIPGSPWRSPTCAPWPPVPMDPQPPVAGQHPSWRHWLARAEGKHDLTILILSLAGIWGRLCRGEVCSISPSRCSSKVKAPSGSHG